MWNPSRRGSRPSYRLRLVLLGALPLALSDGPLAAGLAASCHIHPPPELVERGEQPPTIGPYGTSAACEAQRQALFGDLGRCHCFQTFSPRAGMGRGGEGERLEPRGAGRDLGPPLP